MSTPKNRAPERQSHEIEVFVCLQKDTKQFVTSHSSIVLIFVVVDHPFSLTVSSTRTKYTVELYDVTVLLSISLETNHPQNL